ncbi:MAG: hypothetical protein NTV22_11590 [bacterium]|nr:hypothetical protein [bacterium]
MNPARWIVISIGAVLLLLLAACMHVNQATQLTYFLHTDYEAFDVQEEPGLSVSNYVAYCMMPMDKTDDASAKMLQKIAEMYLTSNGYYKLTQPELMAEPKLIPLTFLVGLSYVQSFAYETLQLQMNLYYVDPATRKNVQFWSWKAKYDGYPVSRTTIEPAFRDLFIKQPMDWGEQATMFPPMGAPLQQREQFYEWLANARVRLQNAPPAAPRD